MNRHVLTAVLSALLLALPGGPALAQWNPEPGDLLWSQEIGGQLWAPLMHRDGVLYFGSDDSTFYAFDIESREVKWRFHTGGMIRSGAEIIGKVVVFASDDGFLYALALESGKESWRFDLGSAGIDRVLPAIDPPYSYDYRHSSPLNRGGVIYVGSADGVLYAIYEEIGLLSPSGRTTSGHRLYTRREIQRLQQIRSLQQLGMGLSEIAECFENGRIDAKGVVRDHLERVRKEMGALGRLESLLDNILGLLDADEHDDGSTTETFLKTVEIMTMLDKYFTQEQQKQLHDHQASGTETVTPVVEDRIVVELKAVSRVENVHLATARSYLRALDLDDGLVLNFAAAPLGIRRVSGRPPRP